jgi:hypothetical protein
MAWRKWWIQARSQVSYLTHMRKELMIATPLVLYLLVKLPKLVMAKSYGSPAMITL